MDEKTKKILAYIAHMILEVENFDYVSKTDYYTLIEISHGDFSRFEEE